MYYSKPKYGSRLDTSCYQAKLKYLHYTNVLLLYVVEHAKYTHNKRVKKKSKPMSLFFSFLAG